MRYVAYHDDFVNVFWNCWKADSPDFRFQRVTFLCDWAGGSNVCKKVPFGENETAFTLETWIDRISTPLCVSYMLTDFSVVTASMLPSSLNTAETHGILYDVYILHIYRERERLWAKYYEEIWKTNGNSMNNNLSVDADLTQTTWRLFSFFVKLERKKQTKISMQESLTQIIGISLSFLLHM